MLHYVNGFGNRLLKKGEYLIKNLDEFVAQYPQIYEKITGKDLLIGMHFWS